MRVSLLALLLVPVLSASAFRSADPAQPDAEWVFDEPGFLAMMTQRHQAVAAGSAGSVAFSLPTLRGYDGKGHEVLSVLGFDGIGFADTLRAATARTGDPRLTLANELAAARDSLGGAAEVGTLPPADLTLVEYEAEWCSPCRLQAAAVAAFIEAHPDLRITWVQVEADPTAWGTPTENGRMISMDRDS